MSKKHRGRGVFLLHPALKKTFTHLFLYLPDVTLNCSVLSENGAKKVTGKSRSFHSVALSEYACKHFDDGGEGLADFRGL